MDTLKNGRYCDFFAGLQNPNTNIDLKLIEYSKGLPYVFFIDRDYKGCPDFPIEHFKLPLGLFLEYALGHLSGFVNIGTDIRQLKLGLFNLGIDMNNVQLFQDLLSKISFIIKNVPKIKSIEKIKFKMNDTNFQQEFDCVSYVNELFEFISVMVKSANIIETTKTKVFEIKDT